MPFPDAGDLDDSSIHSNGNSNPERRGPAWRLCARCLFVAAAVALAVAAFL
jgi:hypothetical protein